MMAAAPHVQDMREVLGMTQEELALQLECCVRTIQRWEAGESKPKKAVVDALRLLSLTRARGGHVLRPQPSRFTFVDLFAGIGGMRTAFEAVGGECVFTSEIDRFSRKAYAENFDSLHTPVGDIWPNIEATPPHDVLLAGFPCQPFSIAGVSKKNALGRPHGFACERQGNLFFAIEKILSKHEPQAFLLENVKNLASHDHGRTFEIITNVLEKQLGYNVFVKVVDARWFVPQHRERIFIVGFKDKAVRFDWKKVRLPREAPLLGSILHPQDGSEPAEPPYTQGAHGVVSDKYRLSNQLWDYLQSYAEKHRQRGNGFGFGLFDEKGVARTLSARYHKDGSEILINDGRGNPRRLTPRECSRLMGFDRPKKPPFRIVVSDTQAYRQFGNAVVVPVVEAIAKAMRPHLVTRQPQLEMSDLLESA